MKAEAHPYLSLATWMFLFLALLGAGQPSPGLVPAGFEVLLEAPGLSVYERGEDGGEMEYVQVVDLSAGAQLDLLQGAMLDAGRGEGIYGGASPRFKRRFMGPAWEATVARWPDVVCLSNGQFFKDTVNGAWVDPTELAFPLKSDGLVLSEGYDRYRFRRHRRMLELWSDRAEIRRLTRQALSASTAPDVIVGLDPEARVRSSEKLGRTFVGVDDRDGDGIQESVLIYSGSAATQEQAEDALRAFGAEEVMMLDGGGSTQLHCLGTAYISQARPLPQMMATIAAPQGPELHLDYLRSNLQRLMGWLLGEW